MQIKPLSNYVLLSPFKQEEKTAAGLYRPDTAKEEKSQQAVVVEVGEDVTTVSKGDKVIIKKFSGDEFKVNGEDYLLVKLPDIIAIIED